MSGSFDKKSAGAARRLERAEKERKEKRKTRIITLSVVVVLVVLFAGALFLNSKFARRTMTAVTVGGVNFTAVEFDYFYHTSYQEYRQNMTDQWGDYASSMLPSTERPLSSQIFDQETGRTWADFFVDYAFLQMTEAVQYHNAATAAGYKLPDDKRADMDGEIADFKQYVELYTEFDSYLQMLYGSNINESSFRKINEFIYTANAYSEYVRDTFSYSPAELDAYYFEHRDSLDIFTYRYFLVSAESVSQEDYPTDEEYDAAKEAALAEAAVMAAEIFASIDNEDDFINAAREYDESAYEDRDSTMHSYPGSWLGSYYGPWMRENEHEYGDMTTADMTNGTYIVFYIGRDGNSYNMTEMRQILIMRDFIDPDEFEDGEDDPAYHAAAELADAEARERAENILNLFVEGNATEDFLIGMMEEYSDDTTEGGFYDEISKDYYHNKMVEEIETWLFEPGRQYGDYELIETADYGYHLVFFMGFGEKFSDRLAGDEMRNNDYSEWKENLAPVDTVKRWAFMLTAQ